MTDIKDLVRKNIRDLEPYSSARDEYSGKEAILMDANESPFNQPFNRYPDPGQRKLKGRIAEIYNLSPERIFLGNGSDEAIDLLIRVFCRPGFDRIIIMDPSYGMYRVCADVNNAGVDLVPLNEDFSLDADRILQKAGSSTKMVFLCSPNNPTSNLLEADEIFKILEAFKGIVVLDEAYVDFSNGEGFIPHLNRFANLVILRTLSKAWAGAGIRLGMALGDPYLIELLSSVKYPYNINLLTQEKALDLLNQEDQKKAWVRLILDEREKLAENLGRMKLVEEIHPSDANFLLVRVKNPDELYEYLVRGGIIVRNRSRMTHCRGCLRITVGTPDENLKLIELISAF